MRTIVAVATILLGVIWPHAVAAERTVNTPAQGARAAIGSFSIAAVTDPQYAEADPRGGRQPREGVARLRQAVAQYNQRDLDWGVILGDLIDWDDIDYGAFPGRTETQLPITWAHTRAILAAWRELDAPAHVVLGNHDYYVPYRDADGTAKPASVWRAFGFKDRAYYEFQHRGFRFVVLDGDVSPYNFDSQTEEYRAAKAYWDAVTGPQKTPWNAGISADQIRWLTTVLDQSLSRNEPVVIMCHYPIHRVYNHSLLNSEELLTLLDGYPNVVLWLNGHAHGGDYAKLGTRHHLNLKGMQNNADSWYQIDFSPDRITVYQADDLAEPCYELEMHWPPKADATETAR